MSSRAAKRALGSGGGNGSSTASSFVMPAAASAAPESSGIQLPFFATHVGQEGKHTVKVYGLLGDPWSLLDAAQAMGEQFKVSDKQPELEGKSFPLWTRGTDGDHALHVHLARYGAAGQMEMKFYHLTKPYIFRPAQWVTVDLRKGTVAADFHGPARLINARVVPYSWESKSKKEEKKGQIGHAMQIYAAGIERLTSQSSLSLAEELAGWLPTERLLLPPIFLSGDEFGKAVEEAPPTENDEVLKAIVAAQGKQTARQRAFLSGAQVEVASVKLQGEEKKDLGIVVAPIPPSCVILDINRIVPSGEHHVKNQKAFGERHVLPQRGLAAQATARATLTIGVLDAPSSGHYVRFIVPEKGDATVELGASYRLIVDQSVGPSVAETAPEYEIEHYGIGIGTASMNTIYSEAFVTLRLPFAPLADILLDNPTPAIGGVPLQLVLQPDPASAKLTENTLDQLAGARRELYPNGFHAGHVMYVSPRVAEMLRFKGIPLSHRLARAAFADFAPAMMYGGKDADWWKLQTFHSFDKTKLSEAYYPATPSHNDGWWWLTTYVGGSADGNISSMILKAGMGGEHDEVAPWDLYAFPCFKLGDEEAEALFVDDERLVAAGVVREIVPQRMTIKTTADGDKFIKQQLVKKYLDRPDGKRNKQLFDFLKKEGVDGVEKVWTDPQLWLQPPSDKKPAHTMPLFLIGAVPRRPLVEQEAEQEVDEKPVEPPPAKKARGDDAAAAGGSDESGAAPDAMDQDGDGEVDFKD